MAEITDTPNAERPSRSLEELYKQPELWEMSRYEGNPDQRLRARIIASLIDPDVESVLDVGCGNGFVTRHLNAPRVVGLDPSEEALRHFDGESVVGWANDLPFPAESFDAAVCAEVLEHLPDDVFTRAVAELCRVAKHHLIIGVPYKQDLRAGMVQCLACGERYHIDLHCRSFSSAEELATYFPGFELRSATLLGKAARVRSGLYRTLRYRLLGGSQRSPHARCPRCGRAEVVERKAPLRRWLFDGIGWRLSKEVPANWVIVLLTRRHAGTTNEQS